MDAPFPFAGELAAATSSLLWAVAGVLFVRIRPRPTAGGMNLGKNLVATGLFLGFLLLVEGRAWPTQLSTRSLVLLAASGFVGLAVCDSLLLGAFLTIGPRRSNVYMTLAPALVAGLALLPPLAEVPPLTVWGGMALTLGGILLAVLERPADPQARAALRRGARAALLAAVLQAVGYLLAREGHRGAAITVAEGATVRLAFGTVGLVALGLAGGRLSTWGRELARPRLLAQVALASFLATFLGIGTNQAGIAWARLAGVAATLNALAPVWLIPLSAAFLGERHDLRAWASAILAVAGIATMTSG